MPVTCSFLCLCPAIHLHVLFFFSCVIGAEAHRRMEESWFFLLPNISLALTLG